MQDPKSKTVILARVSSKTQEEEGYSLDSQLKLLLSYCQQHNLNVIKVFKIAETASKEQGRKVFKDLIQFMIKEKIYHLAVEKTDRFTRNFKDAVVIDDWLESDEDRRLHAVKENILLHKNAKSDVKFIWNINVSIAKKYTDNLREEAMKGWKEKLAQGWLPSFPPPGYQTVSVNHKKIHVPNIQTKNIIIDGFKTYLLPGQTIKTITERLYKKGLRTRHNKPYSKSHVARILNNPFYIGINRFNGADYPGAQEKLISEKLFYKVQLKMNGGQTKTFQKHNCPYQGMIRCMDCNSLVTWQLQKGRYYGLCRRLNSVCKCSPALKEENIENTVKIALKQVVSPYPDLIDLVVQRLSKLNIDKTKNNEVIKENLIIQINHYRQMDDNLYDDKLSGLISIEKYKSKHEDFSVKIDRLNQEISNLDSNLNLELDYKIKLIELSQKADLIYQNGSVDQKRLIISKLFDNLTMKGGILSVKYNQVMTIFSQKLEQSINIMKG